MFTRSLKLPANPSESFFLWGPRQTGKSTLLRGRYPKAAWVDLLKTDEQLRYLQRPYLLREELQGAGAPGLVVIDEVQKVPALLDEVHWLIENRGTRFALCGSSARKVRRGHANLLGGRATRYELSGLVSAELGDRFQLERLLNHGYLPRHYLSETPHRLIRSYLNDYLKEEIAEEGLVRSLPAFADFLSAAVLSDAELVNYATIARECGVSSPTVKGYFQILEDTLLGKYLPAYTRRPKRRVIQAPKFYFSDIAIVNHLARRGPLAPGSELFGKAFENWVFHELSTYAQYSEQFFPLSYWRLASGIEVDFVIDQMQVAIEAKASAKVHASDLKGLRELHVEHRPVGRRCLVCLEPRRRTTDDGIEILPYRAFAEELWSGQLAR
jgi:predicted AAA+ superfamily ATPase